MIALGRHPERQLVAVSFGATDITEERGGPAPSRLYIPDLLPDVLEGLIIPGLLLDIETDLNGIGEA